MSIRLLFTLLLLCVSAWSAEAPKTRTGALTAVNGQTAVCDIGDVPAGVSGIVIHRYDDRHAAIVASVIVQSADAKSATLRLLPYEGLRQPNLPTIKTKPQVGDKVILGYLYDRVLPIVPNQVSFEKAKKSFPRLSLIHPDIVAAELAKEKSPLPDRAVLSRTCEKFSLGIIMIMFKDGTDFLDCISWKKLASSPVTSENPDHFKQPFFHRFDTIPTAIYDWGDYTLKTFDDYYRKLEKSE